MPKYYVAATAADGGVSGSVGSDANDGLTVDTPWATLNPFKTVFDAGGLDLATTEIVVSGLIRLPSQTSNGIVLNAMTYSPGSRFFKGIRQWLPSDGYPGFTTNNTQTEQSNNIQRARFTGAFALTTSAATNVASVVTLTTSNLGSGTAATDTLGYITYRYYRNMDRFGRHYGLFLRKTGSNVASAGTQEYRYLTIGASTATITCDGTNVAASPTGSDFEFVTDSSNNAALILFQNFEGRGPDGPALLDGVTLDRFINRTKGAYLASMEGCRNTGFRNVTGYDCGHHCFGITGSGNDGCWLDNVIVCGGYGRSAETAGQQGLEGGNSMSCTATTAQTGFTLTSATNLLTGTWGSSQATPPVGTPILITAGSGFVSNHLVYVSESTSATSFKVSPAPTLSNNATGVGFTVYNICKNHLVRNFDYHIYAPLGLQVTSGTAAPIITRKMIGLSNPNPSASPNNVFTGNVYRNGKVTFYFDSMYNVGSTGTTAIVASNVANGYASDLWNFDTYPMRCEDVVFDGPQQLSGINNRDVAFRRCTFAFAPSVLSNIGNQLGQIRINSREGAGASVSDAINRFLFESCSIIGNMTGGGSSHGTLIGNKNSTGSNQTGWTWTLATLTLSKGGGLSACPVPPAGHTITITGGTGTSAPQIATVASATSTAIVLTSAITATDGAADIAFDVGMAELRAQNSTFMAVGGDAGAATPTVTQMTVAHFGSDGVPAASRGPLMHFRNCILGFDRTTNATTQNIFVNDTNQAPSTATTAKRVCIGNIYLNHTAGQVSDATGLTTNSAFLNRSTGGDTTGWSEYTNVFLNGAISAAINTASHPFVSPPTASGSSPYGGVNRRRYTGQPGPWQSGQSIDDKSNLRGR